VPKSRNNGPKFQSVKQSIAVNPELVELTAPGYPARLELARQDHLRKRNEPRIRSQDLATRPKVTKVLTALLSQAQANDAATAIVPWICDALASPKSRKAYHDDLKAFFEHMAELAVRPYDVTGDHLRLYKEALIQSGKRPASVARALSVIRGTYEQFGKKGLVPWNVVGDIQAVSAPRVEKNTTPAIGEDDACRMLHAPDTDTVIGARDHALLFTYFKTACRSSAIAKAHVGDLERTDTEWFLRVTEKGKKERRLPLLEAAPAVLAWREVVGMSLDDQRMPLFPAIEKERRTPSNRSLSPRNVLHIIKKYAKQVGLKVSDPKRRSICTHSLRKTSAVNALQHGAPVHQVQQWLGHADIRTTQEYITYHDDDIEAAARRCQIR